MTRFISLGLLLCACASAGPIPGGDKPAWVSTPNGDLRYPADRYIAQVGSTQARFGFLEPGQAATVEVRMPVVPPDAQITVTAVARSLPPPA